MGVFKLQEIRKMIGYVQSEQMSISRMVELLNQAADKDKINKNGWMSMADVVRGLECYMNQNENLENHIAVKMQDLKQLMLDKIVKSSIENLKK
jgi:hypothetical protein